MKFGVLCLVLLCSALPLAVLFSVGEVKHAAAGLSAVPGGEILMTDGRNLVRTRRGNRLSELPMPDVTQIEPALNQLSLPSFSMDLLKDGPLTFAAPPAFEGSQLQERRFLSTSAPVVTGDAGWLTLSALLPVGMPFPGMPKSRPSSRSQSSKPTLPGISFPTGDSPLPLVPNVPPNVAEMPEPGALTLFATFLVGSAWALSRMRRLVPLEAGPLKGDETLPQP